MKPNPSNRILLAVLSLFCLAGEQSAYAVSNSWAANASGNWATPASWTGGVNIPGSTTTDNSDVATFSFTLATTGKTVTVDNPRYIGGITFGNTSTLGYTLSGGSLRLNSGGVIQTLSTTGAHTETISSPITISGTSAATATFTSGSSTAANGLMTISGALSGSATTGNTTILTLNGVNTGANQISGAITNGAGGGTLAIVKDGTGNWRLTNSANTFSGGVTVRNGTLEVTTADTVLGGNTVVMGGSGSSGATLITGRTLANPFTMNAPTSGSITLGSNGTTAAGQFSGLITLNNVNFILSNPTNMTTGSVTSSGGITGTGTFVLNNAGTSSTMTVSGAAGVNHTGSITMQGTSTGAATISAAIGSNVTNITQNSNTSTLILSGNNSYSGSTSITTGRLQVNSATGLSTSAVSVASAGQLFLNTTGTVANDITIQGNGYVYATDAGALNGAIRFQGATTSGTITLAADSRVGAFGSTGVGTIAGPIIGTTRNLEINSSSDVNHIGTINLTGNASGLTGLVTVTRGTLRLGTNSNLGGSVLVSDSANLQGDSVGAPGAATIVGSLTLGNPGSTTTGANFLVDPSSSDAMQVNGNVTLNGLNTVSFTGPITTSSVVVLNYSGTLTGGAANLTLPGGLAAYRPGTGFTAGSGQITLNLVQGNIKWTGAATNAWNVTDSNWDDNGSSTTFFNNDVVTFDDIVIKARLTTNLGNATNNDLVFAAKTGGIAGEAIAIDYLDPGVANSPISVSVTGSSVTVSLATDASGLIISTANDVKSAIEGSMPANALVSVLLAAGNDGTGLVTPMPFAFLELPNQAISLITSVIPADMLFAHDALDYSITGSGAIGGSGKLTKQGDGVLTLSTPNTFSGGVILSDGRIRVGNNAALGTGALTMTTGSQLSSDGTTARTVANALNLSGDLVISNGTDTGAMTLSGVVSLTGNTTLEAPTALTIAQTISGVISDGASSFQLKTKGTTAAFALSAANTYDGGTVIEAGRINASNVQAFGTGLVTVENGGQAFLATSGTFANAFRIGGVGVTETAGNLGAIRLAGATVSGPIGLISDASITAHGSTGTLSGNISEVSVPCALELSNYNTATDSTITVSGNNSYTGGTTVKGAIVIANHNNAFGAGPVTIQSNGTAARLTRVQLGTNVVIDNDIVVNSSAQTGFRGAVHSYSGSLTTPSLAVVNGDIEIQSAVGNGGHLASESGSLSVLRVMGAINVTNGVTPSVRIGTVELGGGGNYTQLNHNEGTLRIVTTNGINTSAILGTGQSGATVFDLNGFNQTLAGLTKGSFAATITNNGATASTLTLNMSTATTFGGTFAAGTSAVNLVKSGLGTLTLSGTSDAAVGSLVVNEGGLSLTGTLGNSGFTSTINAGAILSGEGTFGGNLTINGATILANPVTTLGLKANGNLTTASGNSVELTTLPANSSPIEILSCVGVLTSSPAHFSLLNSSIYRNPQFQVNANNVTLTLDAPLDLTWTGVGGTTWDAGVTSNWVDGTLAASKFFNFDNVTFGNSGGGTVSVPNTLSSGSFTVNSNDNWLFQGAGTLQMTSLTKDGTGAVVLDTPWAINGPVALTAGSLQLSVPSAQSLTSALSGTGTLIKAGTEALTVTGTNTSFTGTTVISRGSLIPTSSSALGTNPKITFGNADTLATDILSLTLGTGLTIASPTITVAATSLDTRITSTGSTMSAATITKRGTGKLTIGHASSLGATTNFVTGTSSITVEAGTLAGSSQSPFSSTTTITLGNANTGTAATIVELPANQTTNNDVVTLSSPIVLSPDAPNSEAIFRYPGGTSSGSLSYSGTIALNGRDIYLENTSNVNTPSRLYNVTGVISGNGNVRIRGNSGTTIRVQANSTYTGDLYIMSGRIQTAFNTNGTESIPNTARIIMSAGTTFSLSNTAETIRGLVGGAATEAIPTSALVNQGTGNATTCRLTVSDSNAANTHVFDGRIADGGTGPIAFTKANVATQILNGVNSYTGSTIITGGTLEIGGAGQLGSGTYSAAITITSPGILKFNSTANQTLQTGVISDTGALVKDNTGTLTLTAANTFSGNITVDGGTLIGAGSANSPGVTVFGSRTSTRVITITDGGTLQFNSGNILGASHAAITAPKLVINSGGVVTNGGIATNNALNDIELNGGTLTSSTGHTGSSAPFTPVYGAWNLNGAITSTGNSTISTSDPTKGWIMLKVAGDKISNFNVVSGTLTVSAPVVDNPTDGNIGALTKSGTGTMVMTGANTYTGATTVSAGTLELVGGSQASPVTVSAGASLGFTLGSPTTSTSTFNLSAGTIKITGTPSLVSHTLITSSTGITGTPVLHTPVPGYQLKVVGNSLVLEQAGYSSWAGFNGAGPNLNDDHDNDGVPNGVEYFLGGPSGNTTGFTSLPGVTNTAGTLSVTWVMGSGYAGVYTTDFTVETSDTLTGTWTTESTPGNVTISGSNVTYTFPTPLGIKRFVRLKVTGP